MAEAAGVSVAWLAAGIGPMRRGEGIEEEPLPVAATEENINIQQLLNMTAEVLISDTVYRPALAANIKAFHRSIDLEKDNRELRARVDHLESRMQALEQRQDARKKVVNGE